jgi:hypothetical protein
VEVGLGLEEFSFKIELDELIRISQIIRLGIKIREETENRNENDAKFVPWMMTDGSTVHQFITLETIEKKIKENLQTPKKLSIRYDKVKRL